MFTVPEILMWEHCFSSPREQFPSDFVLPEDQPGQAGVLVIYNFLFEVISSVRHSTNREHLPGTQSVSSILFQKQSCIRLQWIAMMKSCTRMRWPQRIVTRRHCGTTTATSFPTCLQKHLFLFLRLYWLLVGIMRLRMRSFQKNSCKPMYWFLHTRADNTTVESAHTKSHNPPDWLPNPSPIVFEYFSGPAVRESKFRSNFVLGCGFKSLWARKQCCSPTRGPHEKLNTGTLLEVEPGGAGMNNGSAASGTSIGLIHPRLWLFLLAQS